VREPRSLRFRERPGVVTGDVVIDDVDTFSDLAALAGAWCVTGNITVKNAPIPDLHGLESLVAVGNTLTIQGSTR
jgi:hypothetical protein